MVGFRQAREILGVSRGTLQRWIDEKKIHVFRVNRVLRFRPADLQAFIEKNLSA
jgi:excisionase family DNA binding protein